jgi:hypothetical protein
VADLWLCNTFLVFVSVPRGWSAFEPGQRRGNKPPRATNAWTIPAARLSMRPSGIPGAVVGGFTEVTTRIRPNFATV